MAPQRVELFDEDHAYEREYGYATLGDRGLEVWDMTSEKAPGERYGEMFRVAPADLPRLAEALGADEEGLLEAVRARFAVYKAGAAFLAFCRERGVPYASFMAH